MKKPLLLLFALAPSLALAQNAPSVTPPVLAAGAYNSSTPTCTTGNGCYLQTDSHGNLNVNIAGGGGSGGTSQTDQAAFTYGTTAYTPGGCVYNSSITNLTSGQGGAFSCDNTRALFINVLSGSTLYNLLSAGAATNGSTYPSSSLGIGTKDPSGNIQPISAANPAPIALSGLCSGCTASQGSATGTTTATSTTLPAVASVTQYVCGISIRANATAAATGNATLSDGTITLNFTQWTAPTASGVGIIEEQFLPCRPASAVNTAWTLTSAAPGTGGVVSASIWGYNK